MGIRIVLPNNPTLAVANMETPIPLSEFERMARAKSRFRYVFINWIVDSQFWCITYR